VDCLKLLVIESNPAVASFIREMLASQSHPAFELTTVDNLADGAQHLAENQIDLVVLDLSLPGNPGLQNLTRLRTQAPDVPIVVLTALEEDHLALQALREGAQDYLIKSETTRTMLVRALRFAIERKRGEDARSRPAAIVESSLDAIIGMSLEGLIVSWNPGAERIFGYAFEEVIGRYISMLAPPGYADEVPGFLDLLKCGQFIKDFETLRLTKDRQPIHVAASISPIKNSHGRIIGASVIARNIGERIRAEQEREGLLRQLQATLAQVKTLSGLLPICAGCKKIRDDQGYWTTVDVYVREHSQAEFTHGICPDCAAKYRAALPVRKKG
jgi:PAS domain S-box-containing protein